MEDIVLIGLGGHAKGIVDTIEKQKEYRIAGFVDRPGEQGRTYRNYKVIGDDRDLGAIYNRGIKNAFITVGHVDSPQARLRLYNAIKTIGYHLPVIIDDTAAIAADARLEEGTFVGKNAVVGADARIGKMCIINDGAAVEHDCRVGDFSHVAVGASVCGMSHIGNQAFLGANAVVIQCVKIGDYAVVGAGAVILSDVEKGCTVCGVWKKP